MKTEHKQFVVHENKSQTIGGALQESSGESICGVPHENRAQIVGGTLLEI